MARLVDEERASALTRLLDYSTVRSAGKREFFEFLKGRVREFREYLWTEHERGAGGLELVRVHTALIDRLICELYRRASEEYYSKYPRLDFPTAILAVGGYGRKDLCPYSDIDLLILYHYKMTPFVEAVTEEVLYALWDLGFQVGHAVRNVKEVLRMAGEDASIRTALMDYRFICGERKFFESVKKDMDRFLLFTSGDRFIEERIHDLKERHRKHGDVVCLLEPHIKEGKGGLRDLHTAIWVMKVKFKASSMKELSLKGVLPRRSEKNYYYLLDQLLRIRNHMHFLAGRKNDLLTFELQEELARFWGYRQHGIFRAAERFMRFYYVIATQCAQLSEELIEQVERYLPEKKIFPSYFRKRQVIDDRFTIYRGKIYINRSKYLKEDPSLYMKIFQHVQRTGNPLSSQAKRRMKKVLAVVDNEFRGRKDVAARFREILDEGKNLKLVLTEMNDCRFLGKYIPEFSHLFYRAQQDIYHRYTVDIHSIMAATVLPELEERDSKGESLTNEEQQILEIFREVENRALFILAVLFHDIGKGLGHGHSRIGESLVEGIMNRLGFTKEEVDDCKFLVRHHLEMANVAQRRDMHDIELIYNFASLVGSKKRLDMLYLLTYCDLRAVNEDSWNRWRALLLSELYEKTLNIVVQDEFKLPPMKKVIEEAKEKFREKLIGKPVVEVDRFLSELPERYFLSVSADRASDHFELFSSFESDPITKVFPFARKGFTEVALVCSDEHGLFAKVTGTLASHGINILSASAFTTGGGVAFDVFNVDYLGKPLTDEKKIERLVKDLKDVLQGAVEVDELLGKRRVVGKKGKTVQYRPTRVIIDNESSSFFTIVEIFTYDRVGLLYDISRSITGEGYEISLSKISTKADQVADVFYITDRGGEKILDPKKVEKLKERIFESIEGFEVT